jgi:uncharacterized protein HemX
VTTPRQENPRIESVSQNAPTTLYGLAAEIIKTQGVNALLLIGIAWGGYNVASTLTLAMVDFLKQQTAISANMLEISQQSLPFFEKVSAEHREHQTLLKLATDNQRAIIDNQEQMIELQKQTIACLEKRGQIPN